MNKTAEIRKITILGNVCNIISVLFTLILCIPLPIVYIFLENTKTYFSILDSFKKYLNGEIDLKALNMKNKNIKIRLTIFSVIAFFASTALIAGNNSNDFEIRGNYIFASTFAILISLCYYQCFAVKKYLENNFEHNLNKNIK